MHVQKKKSKIMTQLPERGAEDNVIIPFAGEPLASQQFIQEYNRNRALAEATTNRGGAKNNALNYVIVSLDPGNCLQSLRVITPFLSPHPENWQLWGG